MKTNSKLSALPVIHKDAMDLDTLQAELAMANKRVAQAVRRRDEIMEPLMELLRKKAIDDLEKRGIKLRETVVIVSHRVWTDDARHYSPAFVMDVTVELRHFYDDDADVFDSELLKPHVRYVFAKVRKDGQPSKAGTGGLEYGNIERIA